jgi:hypothetical protein
VGSELLNEISGLSAESRDAIFGGEQSFDERFS